MLVFSLTAFNHKGAQGYSTMSLKGFLAISY
jgi:hypothetical protein